MQNFGTIVQRFRPGRSTFVAAAFGCCLTTIGLAAIGDARAQAAAPEAKPVARPGKPAAQPAKPATTANSLDDALLEDLDNELLDGVKDLPVKKGSSRGGEKPSGDDPPADDSNEGPSQTDAGDTDGEMAQSETARDEEPLARIGQQMRTVEKLLERRQATGDTERLQGQILNDLADLIKKLEQQSQSQSMSSSKSSKPQSEQASREAVKQPKSGSGNPASQPSSKPAKESTERLGKNNVQKPDLDAVKGLLKDAWGQLPPHAREQMLQSPPEQFLPKYELLIEKYYKRLAEEQKPKP